MGDKDSTSNTIKEITTETFKPENFLVKLADFDVVEDKYMAISLNYRGDICSKEANSTVQYVKNNKKVTFVEWCPTGFKIGLNDVPPATVENDDMCVMKRNVVMIANNVAINRVFQERLSFPSKLPIWTTSLAAAATNSNCPILEFKVLAHHGLRRGAWNGPRRNDHNQRACLFFCT